MSLQLAQAFQGVVTEHLIDELRLQAPQFAKIFNVQVVNTPYVQTQSWAGYPNFARRTKLEPFARGEATASFPLRIPIVNYGQCDFFPEEDMDDNLFAAVSELLPSTGGGFARAAINTQEQETANYLISQFATTGANWGTADNQPLFGVTSHAISATNSTRTFQTGFTTPVDLSYAAIKYAEIQIANQYASSGAAFIQNQAKTLVCHPNSKYEAGLILNNEFEPDSGNRNKNLIKKLDITPVFWPYFNLSGAQGSLNAAYNGWVLLGEKNELNFYARQKPKIVTETLKSNNAYSVYATIRFGMGVPDSRGLFGSPGL